jgi:hypothetical protein
MFEGFNELPAELLLQIAEKLDLNSLRFFGATNKHNLQLAIQLAEKYVNNLLSNAKIISAPSLDNSFYFILNDAKEIYGFNKEKKTFFQKQEISIFDSNTLDEFDNPSSSSEFFSWTPVTFPYHPDNNQHHFGKVFKMVYFWDNQSSHHYFRDTPKFLFLTETGVWEVAINENPLNFSLLLPLESNPLQSPFPQITVASDNTSAFCTMDDKFWSWGNNTVAQLGYNDDEGIDQQFTQTPREIFGFKGQILQVLSNDGSTFLLTEEGVWVCGGNYRGQLGLDIHDLSPSFQRLTGYLGKPFKVVSNEDSTFILTDKGVWACGDNECGRLGVGLAKVQCEQLAPVINFLGKPLNVIINGGATFLITAQELRACGNNESGQLGLGDDENRTQFEIVTGYEGRIIKIVMTANAFSTFLLTEKGIWAWGANERGQLGLGHNELAYTPLPVPNCSGKPLDILVNKNSIFILTDEGINTLKIKPEDIGAYPTFSFVSLASRPLQMQMLPGEEGIVVLTEKGLWVCEYNGGVFQSLNLFSLLAQEAPAHMASSTLMELAKTCDFLVKVRNLPNNVTSSAVDIEEKPVPQKRALEGENEENKNKQMRFGTSTGAGD